MNHKFTIVLNKKIETGTALNAASHMVASLISKADDETKKNMYFLEYEDASCGKHLVSGLSLIVLKANNSNKIRVAKQQAVESGLLHSDFLESMTGDTFKEQMEKTKTLEEEDLNYYGLALFGEKSKLDAITSKFSLWR